MRKGLGKGSDLDDDVAALVATLQAENELAVHNDNWLVSYADLMTLLFGFFAMLYLMNGNLDRVNQVAANTPMAQETKAAPVDAAGANPDVRLVPNIHSKKMGGAGGNLGWFFVEFLPPELVQLLAGTSFLYFLVYRFGLRRLRLERMLPVDLSGEISVPALAVKRAGLAEAVGEAPVLADGDLFGWDEERELDEEGNGPTLSDERWLISYADLMTLLFGFFAMLYLMGPNFDAVKKAMENTFASTAVPTAPSSEKSVAERMVLPTDLSAEIAKEPIASPNPAPVTVPPAATEPLAEPVASAVATSVPASSGTAAAPTMSLKEIQEQEANRWKTLRERIAKNKGERQADDKAGAGMGGQGSGGGRGKNLGNGAHAGAGNTICDSTTSIPYQAFCGGNGFYGCLDPEKLYGLGGQNGEGSALEFYCVGGRTRICLTWERCPWRIEPDDPNDYPDGLTLTHASQFGMYCSPYGLNLREGGVRTQLAVCKQGNDCGFTKMDCDAAGQLTVIP